MFSKKGLLVNIWLLCFLVACFRAAEENIPSTVTSQALITPVQSPTSAASPTLNPAPTHTPTPTQTAVATAIVPPTPTLASVFTETAVFGDPIAQRLLSLTNGRFAIQTVQGFAIYDEADLANVVQFIPVEPLGWPRIRLSPSAEHVIWHNENGRLFVQRLADGAVLLEVPGTGNPNGWDHPSFHTSPQGSYGWLFDGEAYSDELPVVTLYRLQDGAELAQFRGDLPQFSNDEAFFVRDTNEGLLIYDVTQPTQPFYTVARDEEISFWEIDLTADWLQITKYLRTEERPFVELRNLATGELWHTFPLADDEARVILSPDGQTLAITFKQDDGADSPTVVAAGVRLYSVSGELRHEFLAPPTPHLPVPSVCDGVWTSRRSDLVYSLIGVNFAPDGRSFSVTYSDYVADSLTHLYATESGEKLAELVGHESLFTANGRSFLSGSQAVKFT